MQHKGCQGHELSGDVHICEVQYTWNDAVGDVMIKPLFFLYSARTKLSISYGCLIVTLM